MHYAPTTPVRGAILHIHAWCEEMNKSRRMVAMQARALADSGFAVLQIDLLGCGDSAGDFGDATWADWLDDVSIGRRWLLDRYKAAFWLWGLRAGCLLARQSADLPVYADQACNFLFWQPVTMGKTHLQQFLRLKSAGALIDGQNKGVLDAVKRELAAGRCVDIAGYTLNPALAAGLETAALDPPDVQGRLVWIEVSTRADAALTPAAANLLQGWRAAGFDVHSEIVTGPTFWQTVDIEDAPSLIAASVAAISRHPE